MPAKKLRCIDLFSGCGGLSLGLREVAHVVTYCERNEACQRTLRHNMARRRLDRAPIYDDVTSFPKRLAGGGKIDLVCGGFPCQDISWAGPHSRKGLRGERSGLFYAAMDVVRTYKPKFVFLENVASITAQPKVWRPVLEELDDAGYSWGTPMSSWKSESHRV